MHLLLLTVWLMHCAKTKSSRSSYIVFLKEPEVTNHAEPDEHCGCSQQDTADIIVCQVLQEERKYK